MFVIAKKCMALVLVSALASSYVSAVFDDTVAKAVAAKSAGNAKELANQCSSLASKGRILRYALNEKQKDQIYTACGPIFKYGTDKKTYAVNQPDPKDATKYKDPKAFASVAFSAPRILKAVENESQCRAIGKDLFSLADNDFKVGVSAGRTNFIRSVCGDYFAQNAGDSSSFGKMNDSAYHKLDSNFWRASTFDPLRASLTVAAKNSEGSMSRTGACKALAGDLPTKFLNDENQRLACLVCGSSWESNGDKKALMNTCSRIKYDEKAISGDTEVVDEAPATPAPVATSARKKTSLTSKANDLDSYASDYANNASSVRNKISGNASSSNTLAALKAKYGMS